MGIATSEDIKKMAQFAVFHHLGVDPIRKAIQGATVKNLKNREYLYKVGDAAESFCIVLKGALKLIRPSLKGDEVIVHIATEGDVLAAMLMSSNESSPFPVHVRAIHPSKVICIPRSTFQMHWMKDAELLVRLNTILFQRMNNIQNDKMMFTAPLKNRIASLLIRHLSDCNSSGSSCHTSNSEELLQNPDLSLTIPQPMPLTNSGALSVFLTRQEIADSLGVAVESVIRIMSEWTHAGIIQSKDHRIEILKINQLL